MSGGKRVLALVTDGYGGNGGIAAYARDSIAAMAADPRVGEVIVVPRIVGANEEPIPPRVRLERGAARDDRAYVATLARLAMRERFDAVWVNHLNLAPFAWLMARRSGARMGLVLHGVEAWSASPRRAVRSAVRRADLLLPVSQVTLDRFRVAYGVGESATILSPGAVDLDRFTPGPRDAALARRLGVDGRRVIMTIGRLASAERDAKGFGRVIAALPRLIERWPDLVYVIGGDGFAREQLEQGAIRLGVADHVRFAGKIAEREKADFYRLCDAFVLPSVREGLGIVLLEAMACGVPTIASDRDGGREAVAGMGWTVDPYVVSELRAALVEAFESPRIRPEGIKRFSSVAMAVRVSEALTALIDAR